MQPGHADAPPPRDPPGGHDRHDGRKKRRWPLVLGALVVIALAAQGIWSRHNAQAALERDAQRASTLAVQVVTPQRSARALDLVLPGNVQAFLDTPIYARTNGYLRKWYADIGAHVKAGQLLAEIEAPEVDDQLRAARADLANAEANYALAKTTADRWTQMLQTRSVAKQDADEKVGDMLAKKATLIPSHQPIATAMLTIKLFLIMPTLIQMRPLAIAIIVLIT